MICPNCGHANPADAKFCEACGTKLPAVEAGWTCPNCQHLNPAANRFCESCGTARPEATTAQGPGESLDAPAEKPAEGAPEKQGDAAPEKASDPTDEKGGDDPADNGAKAAEPTENPASSAEANANTWVCPNCQHVNTDANRFCEACGTPRSVASEASTANAVKGADEAAEPTWVCAICHHVNAEGNRFCEACGTPRSVATQNDTVSVPNVDAEPAESTWVCPNCQHVNPADNRFCEACGTPQLDVGSDTVTSAVAPKDSAADAAPAVGADTHADAAEVASEAPAESAATITPGEEKRRDDAADNDTVAEKTAEPAATTAAPSEAPIPVSVTASPGAENSTGSDAPTSAPAKPTVVKADTTVPPTASTTQAPEMTRTTHAKQSSRKPWVGVLVVVLVVFVAVGAYLALGRGGNADQAQKQATSESSSGAQKESNAESIASSAATKGKTIDFPTGKIRADLRNTIGKIPGINAGYVGDANGTDEVSDRFGGDSDYAPAAGTIDVMIMIATYDAVDKGSLQLDKTYTVDAADRVGGTGEMQNLADGKTLTFQEIVTYLIQNNDNMAANVLIRELGGLNAVTQTLQDLGFSSTIVGRKMMDTAAKAVGEDNETSPRDLGHALRGIYQGTLVSKEASKAMLGLLSRGTNRGLLGMNIPTTISVINKTGAITENDGSGTGIMNDAAILVKDKDHAVIVVAMSNGAIGKDQTAAMNDLGALIYQDVLQ